MKYPYYVEYTESGFPILQLPDEVDLVTVFLASDVQGPLGRSIFLEEIERVLKGETSYSEVSGNMCCLKIKKDFTTVIDMLAEDPDDPGNECIMETEELKNLILAWLQLPWFDAKPRETDAIHRIPASVTDQSLLGNELPNQIREIQ